MAKFTVLVALVYIIGIVISLFQGAHWAFYLYQLVYFLNPENRWWSNTLPAFSYSYVTVIIIIFTYILHFRKYSKNKFFEIPQTKWLILLTAVYWLVYFYAVDQEFHKNAAIEFSKMIIIIGFAYKILNTQKHLEWSLLTYIVGSAYIGYEALVVGRNFNSRVEGIGLIDAPEANGTAAAIVATLPLIVYFLWQGNRKVNIAMIILGPLIVNGLILINSRGAFLGAAIGIIVFMLPMFFSKFQIKNQKAAALGLALLGIVGLVVLVDSTFIERMVSLTNSEDETASGSYRVHIWMETFDILADYPFGVGARGYELLSSFYISEEFNTRKYRAVHSIWFQTLAEIGWHGFVIFCFLVYSSFRSLILVKKRSEAMGDHNSFYLAHALLSAYVGLLVASSFINQFRVQVFYWLILFIACLHSIALNSNPKNNEQEES